MVMEGDLTWSGEHTIQYTDDLLQNCTYETYIISLTNVTSIYSIKKKERKKERNIYWPHTLSFKSQIKYNFLFFEAFSDHPENYVSIIFKNIIIGFAMFHCFCLCAYSVFPSRLLTVSSGRVRHMLYSSLYQQSLTPCLGGNTMFITSQLWDFSHKHLWHCGSLFHICCLLVCSPIRAVFGAVVVIFTLKLGQSIEKLDDFPKVTL